MSPIIADKKPALELALEAVEASGSKLPEFVEIIDVEANMFDTSGLGSANFDISGITSVMDISVVESSNEVLEEHDENELDKAIISVGGSG